MDFFVYKEKGKKIQFQSNGKKEQFKQLLSSFEQSGKLFKISIEEIETFSTEKQRNLLQVLLSKIAEDTGHSKEEVEHNISDKFYPKILKENILGESRKEIVPMEDWTNYQFNEVFEKTIQFCNEFFEMNLAIETQGGYSVITNK